MTHPKIKIVPATVEILEDGGFTNHTQQIARQEFFDNFCHFYPPHTEAAKLAGISLDEFLGLESGELTTDEKGWKEMSLKVFGGES